MSQAPIESLLKEVRSGSKHALAELLKRYRPLLLTLAKKAISNQLAGKVSPSDAVQETCIDAVRSSSDLRANTEAECRAWLCALLIRNIEDAERRFIHARKRQVKRERPLSAGDSRHRATELRSTGGSPYEQAVSREELATFEAALERLSNDHREVIELRSRDRLPFTEIAILQGKNPDAVRMTWNRAVEQLARELRRGTK